MCVNAFVYLFCCFVWESGTSKLKTPWFIILYEKGHTANGGVCLPAVIPYVQCSDVYIYIYTHTHIHIHVCTSTYLHIPHISHVSWFKRRSVGHHERLLHFLHRRTPLHSENRTTEILGEALPKEGVYGQVVGWQSSCNWCDFTRIRFLGWTVKYTWRGFLWCKKTWDFWVWVDKAYRLRWMGSWTDRNEEQTNQNKSR